MKRVETEEHIEYQNYPLNSVLSDCAKKAGYIHWPNTELADKTRYLVTGTIPKTSTGLESYFELAAVYGCSGFLKGTSLYCLTEEQLAKLPRDKFLWKVRYIEPEDISAAIDRIRQCFTAVDSKVEYLEKRKVIRIEGRTDEVEKAELLLDALDSETGRTEKTSKPQPEKKSIDAEDADMKPD